MNDKGLSLFEGIGGVLDALLKDLDPSLFQNVVLVILAIFIPIAIVLISDIFAKNKTTDAFHIKVLTDEVLDIRIVLIVSILGAIVFSFFSGTNTS